MQGIFLFPPGGDVTCEAKLRAREETCSWLLTVTYWAKEAISVCSNILFLYSWLWWTGTRKLTQTEGENKQKGANSHNMKVILKRIPGGVVSRVFRRYFYFFFPVLSLARFSSSVLVLNLNKLVKLASCCGNMSEMHRPVEQQHPIWQYKQNKTKHKKKKNLKLLTIRATRFMSPGDAFSVLSPFPCRWR